MVFTILSDLHLNFWFSNKRHPFTKRIKKVFDAYLDPNPDVEVLVIAGDISHYNYQVGIIEDIAKLYNYKKVFCVLGNHDICTSGDMGSLERQALWYSYKSDVVSILNGTCETYKGVKFGGAMGWYDGTRNRPVGWTRDHVLQFWKEHRGDYYNVDDYTDMYEIFNQELPKVSAILDADVTITHVCPIIAARACPEEFRFSKTAMFYAFNGEYLVEKTNAKCWVFGHTHGDIDIDISNTRLVMHTLGYPGEEGTSSIKNIEIIL